MSRQAAQGVITHLCISNGGVPKSPIAHARIGALGLEGDKQNNTELHGGPDRAVCLFSMDVIERLNAEGHPISPGAAGENVTIRGIDWGLVREGCRLKFSGGVALEVTWYAKPCGKICACFTNAEIRRIHQDDHPGESRVYARVLTEGEARVGESVILTNR